MIGLQKASRGWCEKMVDVAEDQTYGSHVQFLYLCFSISQNLYYLVTFLSTSSLVRFRVVLSPQPTPATLYLLKRCKWAETEDISKLNQIEVCPKAMDLTHNIAKRISSDGGGALIIDYGLNGIVSDSLQVQCLIYMQYAHACSLIVPVQITMLYNHSFYYVVNMHHSLLGQLE